MNDFLRRLAADRAEADVKGTWTSWVEKYGAEGSEVWDITGDSSLTEATSSFLAMVPDRLFMTGYVVEAPAQAYGHLGSKSDAGGSFRTGLRFIGSGASDRWKREGEQIEFVRITRSYTDDGFPNSDSWTIFRDGTRVAPGVSPSWMYEAMSVFVREHGL